MLIGLSSINCTTISYTSHERAVYRTRRPNGTSTFSVCVGIVRVSVLLHGMTEVVSFDVLAPTLQNCGV